MKFLIFISLSLLNIFAYCQQSIDKLPLQEQEKVLKIIYEGGSGAKYGSRTVLTITPDSIFYSSISWSHDSTINEQPKMVRNTLNKHQKNDSQSWQNLISTINLTEFDKGKDNEDNRATDGVGATISIITSLKRHTRSFGMVMNYENDKPIKDFLDEFRKQFKNFE